MPKGKRGEKRPADLNKLAHSIMKVATEGETLPISYRSQAGKIGAKKRFQKLSKKKRSQIAKQAAKARWNV